MICLAAGMTHATNIKQGINAHTTSTAALRWKWAATSLERRLLRMPANMTANTSAASSAQIPNITVRNISTSP